MYSSLLKQQTSKPNYNRFLLKLYAMYNLSSFFIINKLLWTYLPTEIRIVPLVLVFLLLWMDMNYNGYTMKKYVPVHKCVGTKVWHDTLYGGMNV